MDLEINQPKSDMKEFQIIDRHCRASLSPPVQPSTIYVVCEMTQAGAVLVSTEGNGRSSAKIRFNQFLARALTDTSPRHGPTNQNPLWRSRLRADFLPRWSPVDNIDLNRRSTWDPHLLHYSRDRTGPESPPESSDLDASLTLLLIW